MSFVFWLAFVLASVVMFSIPGTTVLIVLSYSVALGRRGCRCGARVRPFHSTCRLAPQIESSAGSLCNMFTVVTLIGGQYLLYLGVRMLRARISVTDDAVRTAPDSRWLLFVNTFPVTVFNPHSILFFAAFFPQFVNYDTGVSQQLWLLGVTHIVMAVCVVSAYSALAASANHLVASTQVQKRLNLAGGHCCRFPRCEHCSQDMPPDRRQGRRAPAPRRNAP